MADSAVQCLTDLLVTAALSPIVDHNAELAARLCVIDAVGCGMAGVETPVVARLMQVSKMMGSGPVRLIGSDQGTSLADAALITGAAMHALDFDDMHPAMYGHPSVAILPSLLVLRSQRNLDDKRCLTAFVAGVDVACLLGRYLGPDHYDAGFHASATLGSIAAAAAASYALGLDTIRTRHALGLAASGSAGLKSLFGSMGKPVQLGRAAETGLRAALMAQAGITASHDTIDGSSGFAGTHSKTGSLTAAVDGMQERPFVTSIRIKRYPTCYLTHSTIQACETLRSRLKDGAKLAALKITVDEVARDVCAIRKPTTGEELKFSLSGLASLALSGVALSDPRYFENWQPKSLREMGLEDKISLNFQPGFGYGATVTSVDTAGDRIALEEFISEDLRPDHKDAAPIISKFRACAQSSPKRSRALLRLLSADCDVLKTEIRQEMCLSTQERSEIPMAT